MPHRLMLGVTVVVAVVATGCTGPESGEQATSRPTLSSIPGSFALGAGDSDAASEPGASNSTAVESSNSTSADGTLLNPEVDLAGETLFVAAGASLADSVDASPPGTTFVLGPGLHLVDSLAPRSGDTFVGEVGAIVSGDNTYESAFFGDADNVTIRGLIVEEYANPAQRAAIQPTGSGWLIENNEIRENAGAGLWVGTGSRVVGNYIHHNSQIGLLANGAVDAMVVDNEISFNNYLDEYDMAWEAGGTKFIDTTNLEVRHNLVHNNRGPGLWTDADNVGTVYDGNIVLDNAGPGIFHEISYSALIINNQVEGNAFEFYRGGILVANSVDVVVRKNNVIDNDGGILGIHDDRGEFELRNLRVEDNVVAHTEGWTGIRQNIGNDAVYDWNHVFESNLYESPSRASLWYWGNRELTLAEWRSLGLG